MHTTRRKCIRSWLNDVIQTRESEKISRFSKKNRDVEKNTIRKIKKYFMYVYLFFYTFIQLL